jgi:hypothetical protein
MNQSGTVALLLKKNVGDRVTLPPDDYDNRLLGHCIMHWDYGWEQAAACRRIQGLLKVSINNKFGVLLFDIISDNIKCRYVVTSLTQ